MPGASENSQQVRIVNANWVSGEDGRDGRFEVMFITEDDKRHVVTPSPAAVSALVALTQAPTILMWDPDGPTLIAANLLGKMPWTDWGRPSLWPPN
jgi:hypothetical protein